MLRYSRLTLEQGLLEEGQLCTVRCHRQNPRQQKLNVFQIQSTFGSVKGIVYQIFSDSPAPRHTPPGSPDHFLLKITRKYKDDDKERQNRLSFPNKSVKIYIERISYQKLILSIL
jgi:hypothetical protein